MFCFVLYLYSKVIEDVSLTEQNYGFVFKKKTTLVERMSFDNKIFRPKSFLSVGAQWNIQRNSKKWKNLQSFLGKNVLNVSKYKIPF